MGDDNHVVIESDCPLISGVIELKGNGNNLTIGRRTRINDAYLGIHNGTKIAFGTGCLVAAHVDILTTDWHRIFDANGRHINAEEDVIIEDRVWIGGYVTVLKGSHIGNDTVVGYTSCCCRAVASQHHLRWDTRAAC